MFLLLMLFLWKYIDDLIGKGFQWYIILELMAYASATNVAMALPLSVLLSSIMTYGSLGENYELVAIKSAGISLTRAMYPIFIVVCILSVSAFLFSDYMLPIANLKYYSLLYDAREQKSANFLPEGVFSNSFSNNTIRVQRKDPDGQTLYGLTIYSKDPAKNTSFMVIAKQGKMYRSFDDKFLVIELKDGIRYEENSGSGSGVYMPRRVFIRQRFTSTAQKLDLSGITSIKRTDESAFKSAFQMMNIRLLKDTIKILDRKLDSIKVTNYTMMTPYIKYLSLPKKPTTDSVKAIAYQSDWFKKQPLNEQLQAITNAQNEARSITDMLKMRVAAIDAPVKDQRSAFAQYQVKFTLSASCLALFLIGAPMGAIIRKGGLGLPVVISVAFFLLFYIIKTIGEKAAHEGNMSGIVGAWIAIFLITPIGMFLSYKAATDSPIFDMENYRRFFDQAASFVKKTIGRKFN